MNTNLRTSYPQNSNIRQTQSPIIVDRRCPTCISFAIFGEEKSTSTFNFGPEGGRRPFATRLANVSVKTVVATFILINPFGATDVSEIIEFGGKALTIAVAISLGDFGPLYCGILFTILTYFIALLH